MRSGAVPVQDGLMMQEWKLLCWGYAVLWEKDSLSWAPVSPCSDLIPTEETFDLDSFPKLSWINFLWNRWKLHDPTMWSAALSYIWGEETTLKCPVISKAEQLPGFRFFYVTAKTKSQASNLFCCREYSVSYSVTSKVLHPLSIFQGSHRSPRTLSIRF